MSLSRIYTFGGSVADSGVDESESHHVTYVYLSSAFASRDGTSFQSFIPTFFFTATITRFYANIMTEGFLYASTNPKYSPQCPLRQPAVIRRQGKWRVKASGLQAGLILLAVTADNYEIRLYALYE